MAAPAVRKRRRDGRLPNQVRPFAAEQGLLNRADGSARFAQGNTMVLAAVYGPGPAKSMRAEKPNSANLEVLFRPQKGIPGPVEAERELFLRRSLEEAVVLANYPRTVVSVIIQVIADDGAVLSAALNAASLALVNAGVDMTHLPLSAACCIAKDPDRAVVLDPTLAEEAAASATTVTATLSGAGAAGDDGVLSCRAVGAMTREEYFACCEAAARGADAVRSFVRLSMEQKVRREVETIR